MTEAGRENSPVVQSILLCLVIITFILAEVGTFLTSEQTLVIISQIIYLPIIFISFRYPRKAVPLGLCVSLVYLVFALLIRDPANEGIIAPFMQFYVYMSLTIVLSSFFTRFKLNESKHQDIFRHTVNAICIVDTATGSIVEMNPRFHDLLAAGNFKEGTFRLVDLIPDFDSSFLQDLEKKREISIDRQITVKQSDGADLHFLINITSIQGEGLTALIFTDITKRIKAEQDILVQATRLEIINRIISLSNSTDNLDTLLKETLHATLRILHFETGDIYLIDDKAGTARLAYAENSPFPDRETAQEIPLDRLPFSSVLKGGTLFIDNRVTMDSEDPFPEGIVSAAVVPVASGGKVIGSLHVADQKAHTFTDDEKSILRAIGQQLGTALEKMRADNRLRQEEENLYTLFNTIDDFIFILAKDGRILEINEAIIRRLGYSRADLINQSIFKIGGPDPYNQIAPVIHELQNGETGTCPVIIFTKTGVPVDVDCQMREGTWNGEKVIFCISRDITDRKRTEEMLRRRGEILEAVNFSADRFLKEPIHGSTWTSEIPAVIERLGKATDAGRVCIFQNHPCPDNPKDLCISMKFEWTHPSFQPRIDHPLFRNIPFSHRFPEAFMQFSNGLPACFSVDKISFLHDEAAQKNSGLSLINIPIMADTHWWGVLTFELSSEDHKLSKIEIDALMTAAEILGAAIHHLTMVEIYQNPVEHSLVGIFLLQNEIMKYVNPRFAEIFGYSREVLTNKPFIPLLIAPEDKMLVEGHRSRKTQGLEDSSHYIFHGIKKEGTEIVLELFSKRVEYQGQSAIIGTIMDITDRTAAVDALQESEDMFRSLSEVAPVGIFLVDRRGNYFFVNDQWCEIMDLTIDEAAGKGWLGAIYPEDRAAMEAQWDSFTGKGDEITLEQRLLHKNGSITWVYFRALARRNAEGVITGYVGTIVDITDRKKYEETLKASLDEKSVLIMEIHHRVKNNLQIISGLIRLQARQITNEQALAALHECETRVITMALVHESLYQSGNLANINAKRHISNLAHTLLMSDDHERHIKMDIDVDDMPLDMNTAVPASLIINELVINSLKYAFSGRDHGTIRISLHRGPDNRLVLTVGDDGVGIPPGMNITETGSLGMKLVMRLVRDQLKGDLTILSDKGMLFTMRFPAPPATTGTEVMGG